MRLKLSSLIFLFILFSFLLNSCKKKAELHIIYKDIGSVDDIESIDTSIVVPYDYQNALSLKDLSINEKKKKFVEMILPGILVAKYKLKNTQKKVKELTSMDTAKLSSEDKEYLYIILKKYKAKSFDILLYKLNTHPTSIVLAQSAIESGWGTSRFFLEANNIFGIWSYNKSDNRIKAKIKRNGNETYLKKYAYISESIEGYFETIARGPYNKFRKQRTITNDPYDLINYLNNYSELGDEYINQIRLVIKKNDFTKYDSYQIDPEYIY